MIEILRKIVRIPLIPLFLIYAFYVLYKVFENTNAGELEIKRQKGEKIFTEEFYEHHEILFDKYEVHMNVLSMILWFIIICIIK